MAHDKGVGLYAAAIIFGIVAVVHLIRLLMGFQVVIGTWSAPLWVSGAAVVVSGGLAVWLVQLARD